MANSSFSRTFDVAVIGGGAAGVAAAVGAAQAGADVCLIERNGYFGGAATASSVLTYCGFFDRTPAQVVMGVGQLFLDELARRDLYRVQTMPTTGNTVVLLDLETTKFVLDGLVGVAGVTPFLHAVVTDAEVDGSRLEAVTFAHRGGRGRISARSFVDASGDGAVIGASGAAELRTAPAARQASTLVMRMGGVGAEAVPSRDELGQALTSYGRRAGVAFERVEGTVVRLPVSGDVMLLLADEHADVLDVDAVTRAELDGRLLAQHYLRALRSELPGWQAAYLAETGPQLGVRETRRMLGRETLTAAAVTDAVKRPHDGIARGGWPIEDHTEPGRTHYRHIRDDGWFGIPYGALQSAALDNLWGAGRLVSADAGAFASIRVMGTAFATGHAAGVAAALGADHGDPGVAAVRAALLEHGALL